MISILLVHSEYSSLIPLMVYIKKIFQHSVVYEAYTLEEAGNVSKNKNVNLIFFDLDAHDEGNVTNFIQRLQQHITTDSIPIIFLTEAKEEAFYKKVNGLSGYDFIQKPIDKNMFILKLHNYSKVYTNIQLNTNVINDSIIYSETDTEGIITKVSKRFIEISGYTQEELIGKSHNIIRHPTMPNSIYKNMWETIKSGDSWTGTIKNKSKDGSIYIVKATVYPIIHTNGDIIGYASARHDITKEMMEKQRNKNILDAQYSLIIILTNGIITYINKTLFQHYNFKNLADFNMKHNSIAELFEPYDEDALMPMMPDDVPWLDYVKKHNNKNVFAYITDKDSKQHIYDVHYRGKIASNQEIVVFTDVTQLQEQTK
ncbi:PAS domain S-box protein [Sulfurimonas sp.]